MGSFPLYLLRFGRRWQVVSPENNEDIGHTEFWECTVSHLVAAYYRVPHRRLANLPYCQRRARVVGDRVYYGGRPDPDLLSAIRSVVGNGQLVFVYDGHERRLREDVRLFRSLVSRQRR